MQEGISTGFHTSQWHGLLKRDDQGAKILSAVLASRYGDGLKDGVVGETRESFDGFLPQLPCVGKKNLFLDNLTESGMSLALYRMLRKHRKSVGEAGRIMYEIRQPVQFDGASK